MCQNDSTYRGTAERQDFYFKSPLAKLEENEDEADNQAICWLLGIRFLEAPSNILEIGADDLKEELAMSIFAVYLLYTWNYSGRERMWNKNTISDYGHKSHLPYQLRAYRMLVLVFKEYFMGAAYFPSSSSKLIVCISSKKVSLCDGLAHDLYSAGFSFTPASYVTYHRFP